MKLSITIKPCRCVKINLIVFALVFILASMFFLVGCGGTSKASNSSNTTLSDSKYKEATFHSIGFQIPKEAVSQADSDDTAMYGLDNSYDLTIWMEYDPDSKSTGKSWYEAFSEFEDCELVESNGIDICIVLDDNPNPDKVATTLHFSYKGAFYSIVIDYSLDSKKNYKEFADSFYKSIKPVDSGTALQSTEDSSYDIPDGAIEWSKASQYVGKTVTLYGKVVDTEYASSSNSRPTFLDLGAAYPDSSRLSVVIWGKNRKNFSSAPESFYKGKTIAVTGEVYKYDGVCNIEVSSSSQIQVLE